MWLLGLTISVGGGAHQLQQRHARIGHLHHHARRPLHLEMRDASIDGWFAPEADDSFRRPAPGPRSTATRLYDARAASDAEIRTHADALLRTFEPALREMSGSPLVGVLASSQLAQPTLADAVASILADTIGGAADVAACRATLAGILGEPDVLRALVADLHKVEEADPATEDLLQPLLFFKGFHALALHRVAHALWRRGGGADKRAALLLQSRASEKFGVDIHPAATIGLGVMLDHATGIVIGATAVVGDDIYMLHGVTLGATGRPTRHKRHPTIGSGVVLGAQCTILGDCTVAEGATVGASAVVTRDVPRGATVVGVNRVLVDEDHPPDVDSGGSTEYDWFYNI